jgi:predicted RNA-binding protein with PIN domain
MVASLAEYMAYQYTALQVVFNTEYWKNAEENDYTYFANSVLMELFTMGLLDE